MDTRRPVDVLADPRVDPTATWLRTHPEIRIVCRDGSAAYAEAINQGAGQAVQASDRTNEPTGQRPASALDPDP